MMRPKRILLAYEFGSGHGHHVLLSAIENELRKVLPDLVSRFVLPPHSLAVSNEKRGNISFSLELRKPALEKRKPNLVLAHSLCFQLLSDPPVLQSRLAMWLDAIETFKPDIVIADFAPSLSMAAAGRVPCLVVGNGYTIPPPELTKCLPVNPNSTADFQIEEESWLDKLNAALRAAKCQSLRHLSEMNKGDDYALFTIPLFDNYWQNREQRYLGVFHPGGSPQPSSVNDGSVLAYFSKPLDGMRVIEGLIESGLPTVAYLGKLSSEMRNRVLNTNITCVEKPFDLEKELPSRSLSVHAGSLGMSAAGVYAGIPQVGLYHHDEGLSNCRSFEIANIGLSGWVKKLQPEQIAQLLHDAKNSGIMRKYATALSGRYADFRDSNAAARAVPIALALMS